MSQNPAVLLYTADFLTGISDLDMEERGQYITMLCLQHQKGSLTEKIIQLNLGSNATNSVMEKFTRKNDGTFYNKRMQIEINKRANYTESRRNNRLTKKTYDVSYEKHMSGHMDNENENENEDINRRKKGSGEKTKKDPKTLFGEYRHVKLTVKEMDKLRSKFGEGRTEKLIETLDEGIELKGYKYTNHYLAILKWEKREPKSLSEQMKNVEPVMGF